MRRSATTKGDETRLAILGQALDLASEVGIEGLTIGVLAKRAGMSKSGLYAHFESKEVLQTRVLDAAAEKFVDVVLAPALKRPRGLPRLQDLFERWQHWETEGLAGGCLFIAAATELDDRPGPVRDNLVRHLRDMLGTIARAARICVEEGHFRQDLDVDQFAFEAWGLLLTYHQYRRLLQDDAVHKRGRRAFAGLVERSKP